MTPQEDFAEGCRLFAEGCYDRAEQLFSRCLISFPGNPDLLNALASVQEALGRYDQALPLLEEACRLRPDCPEFHYNYANLLRRLASTDAAEAEYLRAIECDPGLAAAYYGLGSLYLSRGRSETAEACLRKTLDLVTDHAAALHDLGQILAGRGMTDDAEQLYRRSITADPRNPAAHNSLGMLLLRSRRVDDARFCFLRALQLDPSYLQARCNLAVLQTWLGDTAPAIEALRQAAREAAEDGDIHYNLALALLTAGQLAEGWQEFEWRFRKARPVEQHHSSIPRWQGETLHGKRMLLHAEQGYGDSLQFIRYASLLAKEGATVYVEGQDARITPLLATADGVSVAFPRGEQVPEVDLQLPMMSLPLVLADHGWPPPAPPYLRPSPELRQIWRTRIAGLPGPRIGLAWAGRPEHDNDANRSLPESCLLPLAQTGCSFVSLQFAGRTAGDLPFRVYDPAGQVQDFADSAALIAELDLVITIDSAVAHLAGGLGVDTWLLLPWNPDWRWMHHRQDSPWYPRMRLFRQSAYQDWQQVLLSVAEELLSRFQGVTNHDP